MSPTRKDALRSFALVPGVIAAAGTFTFPDEKKTSKAAVQYVNKPVNGQLCATCLYYVTGSGKNGSCKIVEGDISPTAWCIDYAAKQDIKTSKGT